MTFATYGLRWTPRRRSWSTSDECDHGSGCPPLRELAYLPAGEFDPHTVAADRPRAGQLPSQVLETLATPVEEPQDSGDAGQSSESASEDDA